MYKYETKQHCLIIARPAGSPTVSIDLTAYKSGITNKLNLPVVEACKLSIELDSLLGLTSRITDTRHNTTYTSPEDKAIGLKGPVIDSKVTIEKKRMPYANAAIEKEHLPCDIPISNLPNPIRLNDPVNRPAHYTDGKIEVIDFIEDKKLDFHLGNTVKYVARAGKKDPAKVVEDLKKAAWYLQRKIDLLEGKFQIKLSS